MDLSDVSLDFDLGGTFVGGLGQSGGVFRSASYQDTPGALYLVAAGVDVRPGSEVVSAWRSLTFPSATGTRRDQSQQGQWAPRLVPRLMEVPLVSPSRKTLALRL